MNPAQLVGGNNTIRLSPLMQAVAANRMQDTPVAAAPGVVNPSVAPGVGMGAPGGTGPPPGAPVSPDPTQPPAQAGPDPAAVAQLQQAAQGGDKNAAALLNAMLIAGGVAGAGAAGAYALSKVRSKPKSGFIPSSAPSQNDAFPSGGPGPKPNIPPNSNVPAVSKARDVEAFNHPHTVEPRISRQVSQQKSLGIPGKGLAPVSTGRETTFATSQMAKRLSAARLAMSASRGLLK